MTKFVFSGEGHTAGGDFPAGAVVALLVVAAVMAWLATILLILAVVLAAVVVLGAGALAVLWRISRPNDRDRELLAERWKAMHQATPKVVEHHHYLHPLGTPAEGGRWLALRDAVTEIRKEP